MKRTDEDKKMEEQTIMHMIAELAETQAVINKTNTDIITAINGLTGKINAFQENLKNLKVLSPSTDLSPLESIVRKSLTDLQAAIEAKPSEVTKKFQVLLFPPQDAKLFYKIVFGDWLLYLVIAFVIKLSFNTFDHWLETRKQIEVEQVRINPVIQAWDSLYTHASKPFRLKMDSILQRGFPPRTSNK